jgi:transcriptional regulator with XRE-family HTH domain
VTVSSKRLGHVIKQLREAKKMSQRALADKVGVTAADITMLETGKRKSPSLPVLKRLAKALGVPVTELLT